MNKISQENAKKVFVEMCEAFGFTVPEEAKEQKIETKIGKLSATVINEIDTAKITIDKIASGAIEFKIEKDEPKIIYNLVRPAICDGVKVDKFVFGVWPLKKAKATGISLNELNAGMEAEDLEIVLMSMTNLSDSDIFGELGLPVINDLRSIVNYFLA